MQASVIPVPQMLMIGSTGRNSGKTTLAVEGIRRWRADRPVVGLKVTSVEHRDGTCPRGGQGCGACSSLAGNYEIIEETDPRSNKDTSRLLGAGCLRVYWLKVLRTHMAEGIEAFLRLLPPGALVVCESNSLRRVVEPGAFLMLHNAGEGLVKETAEGVMAYADRVVAYRVGDSLQGILEGLWVGEENGALRVRAV